MALASQARHGPVDKTDSSGLIYIVDDSHLKYKLD
jgi:hypothetical protein